MARDIAFVGALPPPVHGMALTNQATIAALEQAGHRLTIHNLSPRTGAGRVQYHLSRIGAVLGALTKLARGGRNDAVYLPIDGGLGLLYDVGFGLLFRAQSKPIVVHHHNFSYIDRPSWLMWVFLRLASHRQLHVFLCEQMGAAFEARYRGSLPVGYSSLVLSNAFTMPVPDEASPRGTCGPVVIGHLSNLSVDKGTDLFLDLFETLTASGIEIEARLAGPVTDAALQSRIAAIQSGHAARFHNQGPVYGAEKAAFFAGIDVFVFPTRYRNEAQPLVLLEALSSGCVLATIDRGCIGCDHGGAGGLIAKDVEQFRDQAASWISALAADRQRLKAKQASARAHADQQIEFALEEKFRWLSAIACLCHTP